MRLFGKGMLPGETADPVNDGNLEFDKSKVYVADRTAFAIPEVQNGEDAGGMSWRYEMTFDVNKVMEVCKANNCTPSILMTILMQKGVKSVNPDAAEQILCSMSCDWRESIGLPNTFRNCVSSIYLPYGAEEQEMGMTELGTHFRSLIARQKETDSARCSASVMKMMSDMLDSAPIITTIWNIKKNADCIIYSVHDIAGSSDTRDNEKLADVKELAMGYRQTIKNNYLWNNGKSSV